MAITARPILGFLATRLAPVLLAGALTFSSVSGAAAPSPQVGNSASTSKSISIAAITPSIAAAMPPGGIAFPIEVTITGKNFSSGATVKIGTQAAGIVSATATEIHATIPGEPAGTMDVTVANPDGTAATLPKGFTYTTGPVVYGISPPTGSATEPTVVTITGGNLRSDSVITVGGLAAPIQFFFSATSLEAQVPANPATSGSETAGALTVTNSDGQSFTLPSAFTWSGSGKPSATPAPNLPPAPTSSNQAAADSCGF